jgi:hypothetical protein
MSRTTPEPKATGHSAKDASRREQNPKSSLRYAVLRRYEAARARHPSQ